jgi:hypothetical protein
LTTWFHRVGTGLAYAPAFATVLALLAGARAWFRRTLGRRKDRYDRIALLGTNAHLSFFTSVLSEPAMHRSLVSYVSVLREGGGDEEIEFELQERAFLESIYIDRDFYVQAFSDVDGAVVAFSVTTRSRRFRPALRSPGSYHTGLGRIERLLRLSEGEPIFEIKLGKSRFTSLGEPQKAAAWVGARRMSYYEAYWLGNPGHYQWYVFSINDAGAIAWDAPLIGTILGQDGPWEFEWGFSGEEESNWEKVPGWREFRRKARPSTYTIIGPTLSIDDYPPRTPEREYPASFGPDHDHVRTLP